MPAYADSVIRGLKASSDLSGEILHQGQDLRPCVAIMLQESFGKGETPDRNTLALIISCEFRRIGMHQQFTLHRIERWNNRNLCPLSSSETSKAVRNAFSKNYSYSCRNLALQSFCIGEVCPFHRKLQSGRRSYDDGYFQRYRWPELLTNVATLIYCAALIHLERVRQVGPGGLICAGHREIAGTAGVSRKSVKVGLELLEQCGLIHYTPGVPRKWEGKSSEIRRTIPIPVPPRQLRSKLKE